MAKSCKKKTSLILLDSLEINVDMQSQMPKTTSGKAIIRCPKYQVLKKLAKYALTKNTSTMVV